MSLLNVGLEDNQGKGKGMRPTVLGTDEVFGAFEAGLLEPEELTVGYEKLLNTVDALEDTIVIDRVGTESNAITKDSVQRQLSEMKNVLELGIEENRMPNVDLDKDPVDNILLGIEAKESFIKEIIRKAKEFIKMIINSLKKYSTKLVAAVKTLTMNVSKLKDMAEENEDSITIDPKEDAKLHNRFRDIIGMYADDTLLNSIVGLYQSVEDAYKEVTTKASDDILKDIKNGRADWKMKLVEGVNSMLKDTLGSLPATSSIRALIDKDNLIAVKVISTPNKMYAVGITITDMGKGKKEKWNAYYKHSPISNKAKKHKGTLTADQIRLVADDVVSNFDKYPIQDVINAVYDRLDITDKYISEETKGDKKHTVSKMMKYASYNHKLGLASIRAIIKNQKASYDVLKLLVTEAGN